MEALSDELLRRGLLDSTTRGWAVSHAEREGVPFDTALLELDLIDEEDLLDALETATGLPAASRDELEAPAPDVGARLPEGFSRTFRMCPWRLDGALLVALVAAPLPEDWLAELRDLFGLEVQERVAPAHYLELGRERVYGTPASERATALEARLAERRAADVRRAIEQVSGATDLRSAVEALLSFTEGLLERAGFLLSLEGELYVAASRGYRPETPLVALPAAGGTLRAALEHGGFFAGPLADTPADRTFFEGMGAELPRASVVVPVPAQQDARVVFCADNGPRGIATRRLAELTLLVSRLGAHRGEWSALHGKAPEAPEPRVVPEETARAAPEPTPAPPPVEEPSAEEAAPPAPDHAPPVDDGLRPGERAALDRLREAAEAQGTDVPGLVEALLSARDAPRPAEEPNVALVGEVRGLFERLAQDIPAQLARGMETAFRDMVPRIAASPAAAPQPPAPARSAAASVEIVQKEPAEREVPSYRSRRARTKRVKL